ncbi:MAG: hypothetical protein ABH817_02260 [archaeon]
MVQPIMTKEESKIEVDELKVRKLNMSGKSLDLYFRYYIGDETYNVEKRLGFFDNVINFVMSVLLDMKKTRAGAIILNEDSIKEKIVNTLNRLMQEVGDLNKLKEHTEYMKAFSKIDAHKTNF